MTKIDTSTETVTKISDDLMMTARVGTDNVRHAQLMDDASNVINTLQARAETAEAKLAKAMEALREIITRWDTPAWKDAEATGSVINRARAALAELENN
jgi:polyhydroxyalkanoate synthesis regulator phasin